MDRRYRARITGPHGAVNFLTLPRVNLGGTATYSEYDVTHTNYNFPAYQKSAPEDIAVDGDFFCDTIFAARNAFDAIQFCRAAVKMDFNGSGSPPPMLKFSYLGKEMYNKVPCVMLSYNMQFDDTVDYVPIGTSRDNWLPIQFTLTVTLKPVYSPFKQAQEWNWPEFASGNLIRKGYL